LSKLLELHEYVHEDDPQKTELKEYLKSTRLTKLDREIIKKTTVWDFLSSNANGGAYELEYDDE
jgi:hypothetical protein